MDIRQRTASGEAEAFAAWSDIVGLPPGRFGTLPARDTYDGLLRYGDVASPFRGAEFSVRCGEGDRVSRVAFAPRTVPPDVGRWLGAAADAQQRVARAVADLRGVDLLLGWGESGAKLYLQRPHDTSRASFRRMATGWLRLTGEAVEEDGELDFVCVDFAPQGAMTPKIYRVTNDRATARSWLGASPLAVLLDTLPDAQYVVTLRRSGLVLHARLFDAAPPLLDRGLATAFARLARHIPRRLVPTHLSWSEPHLAQTLYYMVDANA